MRWVTRGFLLPFERHCFPLASAALLGCGSTDYLEAFFVVAAATESLPKQWVFYYRSALRPLTLCSPLTLIHNYSGSPLGAFVGPKASRVRQGQ